MKKTLCVVSVLATLIGTANAANYQNKIFVGASVDAMSMDSNFKNVDQDEIKYGGSDSSIGGSINAGYKAYFAENGNNSFFITPEISWNFASLEAQNNKTVDGGYYVEYYNNKYEVKPMFAFDLAFGYEINQKHSIFAGLGLQYGKYDYSSSLDAFLTPSGTQVQSDPYSKSNYIVGERAFIGYEYNLTKTISLNTKLSYSYMEPNLGDSVKVETDIIDFGIGAKYNF